jgi:Arc/MetJ-type ribon-helix-helix transcriptional regulator
MYHSMPTLEDKVKINARIPKSLYDWIGSVYGNVSQAVNEGLELLKETQTIGCDTEAHKSLQNGSQELTNSSQGVSQEPTYSPQSSPRVVSQEPTNQENAISKELKARLEEKDKQIEEKDRHIETLKSELEKAGQREEDLKKVHNNYMLQMQTLINQKAIEAPGAKKPWWKIW